MKDVAENEEIAELRAHITALEELLEVYEQETLEKSHRLEKALKELVHAKDALQILKSILESMGDAVIVVDLSGTLVFSNNAAENLGYSTEQLISLNDSPTVQPFYHGTTQAPLLASDFPINRAMAGESVDNLEIYRLDQQQQQHWLSVTARSFKDEQGTLEGAVAVFHDITHSKQTELALRESEAQAREQAQKLQQTLIELRRTQAQLIHTEKMSSLGQLVAGIAHEINNPVNFIYGNINPAKDCIDDLLRVLHSYQRHFPDPTPALEAELEAVDLDFIEQDLPRLLKSLELGADRIRQIVSSLRNFSRLDEAEMKPVNVHDGIDNTLLILQSQLKSKPNLREIHVIQQYGDLPLVECYAGQLNQVFMNILSNAIDALHHLRSGEKGDLVDLEPTIWIQTELVGSDRLCVSIRNNGPSIDPVTITRLFDPFFTTKPVGQGTGLGLYISYQIITEKHNGTLECRSAPDQGVEFIIHIPIR
ncbi:MAG: ATP-binding protein [Leptolyngbyaceae cyanobacterium bins.302]|nr:ATP-binding protein [Leptolyngbyaceae cyanobacterium bins.302]